MDGGDGDGHGGGGGMTAMRVERGDDDGGGDDGGNGHDGGCVEGGGGVAEVVVGMMDARGKDCGGGGS